MEIKNLQTLRHFSAEKMQKINLFETRNFFADIYCLEPGQAQKAHAHAGADKIYAVMEGKVVALIGEEEQELSANDAVLAPADVIHGIRNASSERAVVFVFMSPNPNQAKENQ